MASRGIAVAKFETAEFIIGNALLILGGLLVTPNVFSELTFLGTIMMISGVILDIRVFNFSRHERLVLTDKIAHTTRELDDARADMQQLEGSVRDAERKLKHTISEMREQEKTLNEQQKQLKEMQRTTFSFMSRARSSKPLEDIVKEVFNTLDASLKAIEKKLGIWSSRRSPL